MAPRHPRASRVRTRATARVAVVKPARKHVAHPRARDSRPKSGLWSRLVRADRRDYRAILGTTDVERDAAVRAGAPAALYEHLATDMGVPLRMVLETLGVARATADRKIKRHATLDVAATEGVLGMAQLVAQAQAIIEESGNPEGFDAARWVAAWLAEPHPALGGRRPRELMATAPGREAVGRLLGQIEAGAYA